MIPTAMSCSSRCLISKASKAYLQGLRPTNAGYPPNNAPHTTRERELTLVLDTDQRTLILRFGKPIQDVETVDSFNWRCPVQLIGGGKEALHPGVGIDSLQALINAIKIAQIELESLEQETGGEVRWIDQRGYGIPQI